MKLIEMIGIVALFSLFNATPAAAHDCGRSGHHGGDCYNHHGGGCTDCGSSLRRAPETGVSNLQTLEGKISEVVYLPAATPGNGMVEVRLEAAGRSALVRLGPSGFLKQGGILLREGDTVTVKGFPVSAMEGDLIVATEIHQADKTLQLRDPRGRTAW